MAASIWKGHLTFGLVSFPVRLFAAARSESISFNQLHKEDGSRIKQVIFCQSEDKPIPRNEIVKGYEYEKGKYVVVDDEDIKKVAPKTARVMEIQEFVKGDEVDPVFLESSYYMAPDEGGDKPYALLFETMKQTKYYGIAKVAMHNREHVVILRPGEKGMILHTMYYADEVRRADEFNTDASNLKEKEVALAKMLVESLVGEFEPAKYHDTYRDNLRAMIEAKIAGHTVVETPESRVAPVIDIMEALKRSLEMRKPPKVALAAGGSVQEIDAEGKSEAGAGSPRPKRARKVKSA
ncbi:MAG: end-binding protein Ku [Bryobacterales bacterium]|jgi:DNA end-binding protein Ku|nr:end-binding protein Ku [Bryobacterales bacterium]